MLAAQLPRKPKHFTDYVLTGTVSEVIFVGASHIIGCKQYDCEPR